MIASADQNMPEHALICKVVIFSTNSCAVHAKKNGRTLNKSILDLRIY